MATFPISYCSKQVPTDVRGVERQDVAALSAYYTRAEKRLATAKTMGLSIPEAFLVRADEVVE